jgi:hypothetical protein
MVAIAGQPYLQMIDTKNDPEELTQCLTVTHALEISLVKWLNPHNLITIGMDKVVKLSNYHNKYHH